MKKLVVLVIAFWSFQAQAAGSILQLEINGAIHEGTVHMIDESIQRAKAENAQALLITLDTPGGLLESTRKIVKLFLNEDFPIIVYVSPSGARAGSAGTFITLASHIAAMSPGTNIGAAHPVTATGKDPEEGGKHMAEKIENDTIAFMGSIAQQRNRNLDWAKKAVLESASIGETEAKKIGVIDIVATNVTDLLTQIDGKKIKLQTQEITLNTKNVTITRIVPDTKTKLLNLLSHPTTMTLLMAIIGLGLYVEFSHPGLILPAAASIIGIFLFLISTSVIPITMVGTILIIIGFVCFLLELYITSFGLLTVGGIGLFIAGSMLLYDPATSDLKIPHALLWSMSAGIGIVGAIIAFSVGKTIRQPAAVGTSTLIGMKTKLVRPTSANEEGKIFVNGDYWNAHSVHPIEEGHEVEITHVNGLTVTVKRAT